MFKRQTSGSVLCTSCGVLVGVNDETCYNCGRRNPGLWGLRARLAFARRDLGFVPFVIGTCSVLYVLTLLASRGKIGMSGLFGFLSPSGRGAIPLRRHRPRSRQAIRPLVDHPQRVMAARRVRSTSSSTCSSVRQLAPAVAELLRARAHGDHLHRRWRGGLRAERVLGDSICRQSRCWAVAGASPSAPPPASPGCSARSTTTVIAAAVAWPVATRRNQSSSC